MWFSTPDYKENEIYIQKEYINQFVSSKALIENTIQIIPTDSVLILRYNS
ncbi:hypothetical protein [Campylobacter pinnipediorum]|nr:hypothetical protein [Campylobacter pinnipediorum]